MAKNSIFETLSHTADDQLATVFGELYYQLVQHLESNSEDCSKSICIFKRFLNLKCVPNEELLPQLTRICPDLTRFYVQNVSKINQLVDHTCPESVCDQYCSLVGENCQVLSCIRDIFDKVGPKKPISDVQLIILDATSILFVTFKHCNEYSQFYASAPPIFNENINSLFKLCNELLFQFLDFVNSVIIDDNEDADVELLNSILKATFNIGTVVSNLELKTMAQLWKAFTSLLQKYSLALRDHFNLCQAIEYFCTEIEQKISTIYDIPSKNRTVMLKVLNFLLKVVLKLCEYFSGFLSKCLHDLCQLISLLYHNSSTCAKYDGRNLEIALEIENNLLPAIDPLISTLMKEDTFVEYFFDLKKTKSNVSTLQILSVILQKLVLSPPDSVRCELFEAVFQNISSCMAELHFDVRIAVVPSKSLNLPQEVFLYDALLVHMASLIICVVSEQDFHCIEKLLITYLLRSPVGLKLFVCDLWCVLARYGSSELCFEHAKLLVTLLKQIHCDKIETVVIKSLLRRFFKFLSLAQQQKFISFVSNDLSTLVGVVHPKMKCTLSILDDSFLRKTSERAQELSVSPGINSLDIDLLLNVHVACKMNEITTFKQQIQEYILSVWSQVRGTQFQDCGMFLRCMQPLVMVSKSCMLPHGAVLPVIEWLLHSESVFLKLLVLEYLKSLGLRKADDLDIDKFSTSVSSLFRTMLKGQNVLIREQALDTFSYFSHVTVYEKIIQFTIANEPELSKRVMSFLQSKVYLGCQKTCDEFLKSLLQNRQSKTVRNRPASTEFVQTDSNSPQLKKIKLNFDFDREIVEIESRLKSLLGNLNSCELNLAQKSTLKRVVETTDKLRSYL